jgi:hypothetical protein
MRSITRESAIASMMNCRLLLAGKTLLAGAALTCAAFGVLYADERDTICVPGYAAARRPSITWSQGVKRFMCAVREFDGGPDASLCMKAYELDHIVPLCLGGDPEAPDNLQLQPWPEARAKDKLEAATCRAYCRGEITLEDARALFAQ